MNVASFFWLLIGTLTGAAAAFVFGKLWRHSQMAFGRWRSFAIGIVSVGALTGVAIYIYSVIGRPDLVTGIPLSTPHPMPSATDSAASNADPKSMDAVTAQLAQRLARDGGADSEWQLLAQSFDYMGRTEDAAKAREHIVVNSNAMSSTAAESQSPAPLAAIPSTADSDKVSAAIRQTKARPKDASAWLALAEAQRLKRNFAESRTAFETAIRLNGMTADSWADYADVLASTKRDSQSATNTTATPTLAGAPAQAIAKSLALNPNHPKALWLKASLAHEEHRYADALAVWQQLRTIIGNNESDARIIDANIAEDQQLLGSASSPVAAKSVTAKSVAPKSNSSIDGSIDIDPKLIARVAPGSVLFIYAKSIDSPGPPLAVMRTTVTQWPMRFKLDDSMAMLANRTLSSATNVFVEARISKSGQAIAASGDLQTTALRVNVREGKVVHLRIDKEVS